MNSKEYNTIRNSITSSTRKYIPKASELSDSERDEMADAIRDYKRNKNRSQKGTLTYAIEKRINMYGTSVVSGKAYLSSIKTSKIGQSEIVRSTNLYKSLFYPEKEILESMQYGNTEYDIAHEQNAIKNQELMLYLDKQAKVQQTYDKAIKLKGKTGWR